MAVASKTPISLLQELCTQRGITPKYDILSVEGAVHEPTFVIKVTVGDLVYTGSGQSKKKAKHVAAKAVLDKLLGQIVTPDVNGVGDTAENTPWTKVNPVEIISPCDDDIPGNPVGTLQELCMAKKWPPPVYKMVTEQGLPHERNFVITVQVIKSMETGLGKSKKLAKRQAANKLLQLLKDLPEKNDIVGKDDVGSNKQVTEDVGSLSGSLLRDVGGTVGLQRSRESSDNLLLDHFDEQLLVEELQQHDNMLVDKLSGINLDDITLDDNSNLTQQNKPETTSSKHKRRSNKSKGKN